MSRAHKPVTLAPQNGGRLATDISLNDVGVENYRVKRDWRRAEVNREIRREGHLYFWPSEDLPLADQCLNAPEPVTLVVEAQAATGKKAIIAATRTTIYRYFYSTDGAYVGVPEDLEYFDGDYVEDDYVADDTGEEYVSGDANGPYFDDTASQWAVIGSGFSEAGKRWEVCQIGDDIIFSNGVDLPVSYGVGKSAVEPLYELRENGVFAVGTITEFNDVLMLGDIIQARKGVLETLMKPTPLIGTASRTGATWVTDSRATQVIGSNEVNIVSGPFVFTSGMAGKEFRFINGFRRTITTILSPTKAILSGEAPKWSAAYPGNLSLTFFILNGQSDSVVTSTRNVFTADMAGLTLFWSHGMARKILSVLSETQVVCAGDGPIASGTISIENRKAYGTVTDVSLYDRYRYRVAWSAMAKATRFAANVACAITAGSKSLELAYPIKSFQGGMEVIVIGAGIDGGNLIATILTIADGGLRLLLNTTASTTVTLTDGLVQAYDMIGSIVGYDDLDGDGSKIIRMLELNDRLIIYRETGYHTSYYIGETGAPWYFSKRIVTDQAFALAFKHSLAKVTWQGRQMHIYAGKKGFFAFDMVNRMPVTFEPFQVCRKTFFAEAAKGDVTIGGKVYAREDMIFSADNAVTSEIWLCFPSTTADKALCFDYQWGTVSTTGAAYTAAATVTKPGSEHQWFASGAEDGKMLVYGLVGEVGTYSRLGLAYTSEMFSGCGAFGNPNDEKILSGYTLQMSSMSPNVQVTVELYARATPNGAEELLGSAQLDAVEALFPTGYVGHYFSDRLLVSGKDNPCEISLRTYNVDLLRSQSATRSK